MGVEEVMNYWTFDVISFAAGYFIAAVTAFGSMLFFKWLFTGE